MSEASNDATIKCLKRKSEIFSDIAWKNLTPEDIAAKFGPWIPVSERMPDNQDAIVHGLYPLLSADDLDAEWSEGLVVRRLESEGEK